MNLTFPSVDDLTSELTVSGNTPVVLGASSPYQSHAGTALKSDDLCAE